jgi:hypothetical protein
LTDCIFQTKIFDRPCDLKAPPRQFPLEPQ